MGQQGKNQDATRVTVTFDDQTYGRLAAIAETHRISRAWLVRRAVTEFLERHDRGGKQLVLGIPETERAPSS